MPLATLLSRLVPIMDGFVHYGNPFGIAFKRAFAKDGLITITDRSTQVVVSAKVRSYQMFGETWYNGDYDVPGCPLRYDDCVIDIGANQGFYSCYAASQGARVSAFEPFPESWSRLCSNVERNGFSTKVKIENVAVSAMAGKATLLSSDFLGGGANTIVKDHALSVGGDFRPSVEVRTVTLDAILTDISGTVRVCKMDCEGSEYDILSTLSSPRRIDAFAIEFHPGAYSVRDLVATLSSWGSHQVSFAKKGNLLYAVRNDVLSEHADSCR
jgi:FkbM family methyltransferase